MALDRALDIPTVHRLAEYDDKLVAADGEFKASFLPCVINRRSQLEVVGHDAQGEQVLDYLGRITHEAGLNASFAWEGDEIRVSA